MLGYFGHCIGLVETSIFRVLHLALWVTWRSHDLGVDSKLLIFFNWRPSPCPQGTVRHPWNDWIQSPWNYYADCALKERISLLCKDINTCWISCLFRYLQKWPFDFAPTLGYKGSRSLNGRLNSRTMQEMRTPGALLVEVNFIRHFFFRLLSQNIYLFIYF